MNMDNNNVHSENTPESTGYETRDVNLVKVFVYGISGIIVLVALVIFALDYFTAAREEAVYEAVLSPESVALRELRAREVEELNSYEILDAQKGVYRIPIERAMTVMAEEAYREKTADNE